MYHLCGIPLSPHCSHFVGVNEPQIETNHGFLSRIVLGQFGEVWGRWGGSRSVLSLETPNKLYLALSPFADDSEIPRGQVLGIVL